MGMVGRGAGRHGREKRVFAIGAPSIGTTLIRSAPQRCDKTTMDPLIQAVNENCNSPVRCALRTWVQRFSPTLRKNSAGLNWLLADFDAAGEALWTPTADHRGHAVIAVT